MIRIHYILPTLLVLLTPAARAQELTAVNIAPERAPALAAAARAAGLKWSAGSRGAKSFGGSLVVWEARGGVEISPENAVSLGKYVRQGGSLLLSLDSDPGTGPFRLGFMLPTTAWHTQTRASVNAAKNSGSVALAEFEKAFFSAGQPALTAPFYFPIRPFHAVERGEARYERFQRGIPYIDQPVEAGNTFWSRPLLNRNWQIRARGDDVAASPLLLTGRYGAGRVAVFASSLQDEPDTAGTRAFWTPVVRWLTARETAAPAAPVNLPAPVVMVDAAGRALQVTLTNPTAAPLAVQVLARIATWENAPIGDEIRDTAIPANGRTTVTIPLPKPDAIAYQALDYRDAYNLRVGALSADGTTVLCETRLPVDLQPAVAVQVGTENLRASAYPFKAPGPDMLNFPYRMGLEADGYAYPPGQRFNARVTISNGTHNLALLASVFDESKPGNPSTMALNDDAAHAEQGPNTDKVQGYGAWVGGANQENVLSFTFPAPVTLSGVTLVGNPDNYRNFLVHNPGSAIVEIDGQEAGRGEGLDQKFVDNFGDVRLPFAPRTGRVLRLRLPWSNDPIHTPQGDRRRETPWLGEVRILGTTGALPGPVQGTVVLNLRDSFTGALTPAGSQNVTVQPGMAQRLTFSVMTPAAGAAAHFYTLEASFTGQTGRADFMTIQPARPLISLRDLKPASAPEVGFIVSRGFRNVFTTGTGTAEVPPGSWATPDDLIWAYSHQLKQLGAGSRTQANRLYVTESDLRHYSTPWRDFPNGVPFYDVAPDLLVAGLKRDPRWAGSDTVVLSHSDRWDSAPDVDAMNGWQDFIGFDEYLRAQGLAGLKGRTRQDIATEIQAGYGHQWQAFHLERYARAIGNLRAAFAKEGRRVIITAQGSPLVPAKYEAALTDVIRGQSDDSTWGMTEENPTLSVGRQMGILAFNPGWAMSTLLQWGWDSTVLGNAHWHNPVGTTEPSRRHLYDRAWRGTIGWDGQYKSIHTYGYNQNGGFSFTMTPNDWQQFWDVEERQSLISPEAPLGVGLIISTARFAVPGQTAWSGSGGNGKGEADQQVRTVQRTLRALQDAGLSVPFAANAGTLAKWKLDTPLILLDLSGFSVEEIAMLAKLKARGVPLAAFKGAGDLSAPAAALFGVTPAGAALDGKPGEILGGLPVVTGANSLLIAERADDLSVDGARALAPVLQKALALPIVFPAGTAGYGFVSQGQKFIVVEDWREEGRTVEVRLRASGPEASAVDVNTHQTLRIRRDDGDWVIQMPLRPGDGGLIAVDEGVAP